MMSEMTKKIPACDTRRDATDSNLAPLSKLPEWVPSAVRLYLAHTEEGRSLRDIARAEGVHASTVLRQVRRFESRRDDPLIDQALGRLRPAPPLTLPETPPAAGAGPGRQSHPSSAAAATRSEAQMVMPLRNPPSAALPADEAHLLDEARRLLPLLEPEGSLLVVAADMDKAVVLREGPAGSERLAVLDRPLAEIFALRDWIECRRAGRIAQYVLAAEGRALLKRLGAGQGGAFRREGLRQAAGFAEDEGDSRFRPAPETPIAILARRRDGEGHPYLTPQMVAAAERLREDFEVAQMDQGVTQDWGRALTGRVDGGAAGGRAPSSGPGAARDRVMAALAELGPGLGDVVLRCCCWQEGVEAAERQLGWSARSGKVVLRIALDRLARHYAALGDAGKLIG